MPCSSRPRGWRTSPGKPARYPGSRWLSRVRLVYGLIRKIAIVESIPALGVENTLLIVPVALYLASTYVAGRGAFGHHGLTIDALLVSSGLVTAVPLVLFAYGAQRIPYSTVGILQYIAPTLQLGCGVLLFKEPFTHAQAFGFGAIWLALAVYAGDALVRIRQAASDNLPTARHDRPS